MRLHTLTVTAFGPFAGTERVDFDALAASGLFLLRGATGAGKTSVLDAVCFALYGEVPGTRTRSRLRSDHADPQLLTRVVLEVTLGGRRLEITRLPEQLRPKRRGEGYTLEKAQTLLREYTADGWQPLSRSHQEAGEEIGRLLGMSRDQFCQVVLLPQGDFARFLRADAAERADLLGRLFDTRRFSRVEEWLAARRRTGEERLRSAQDELRHLVARLDQEAGPGAEPAAEWIPSEGSPADLSRQAPAWAAVLRGDAAEQLAAAESALRIAEEAHHDHQQRSSAAEALADRQESHRRALLRDAELAAQAPEREADRARLAAARAAAVVESALRLRRSAADAHEAAVRRERDARAACGTDRDAPAAQLSVIEQRLRDDLVRLEAAGQAERRLAGTAAELRRVEAEQQAAEELRDEAERQLDGLPAQEEQLNRRLAEARQGAALAEQLTSRHQDAEQRLAAARHRDQLLVRARRVEAEADAHRETAAKARQSWLDLRERRLDGMAAELARQLQPGAPCPVCGAAEHPAPARPSGEPVTREVEQAAEAEFRRAELAHRDASDRLAALRTEAAAAGDAPTDGVAAEVAGLAAELAAALRAADGLVAAEQGLARLARQRQDHLEQQRTAGARAAVHSDRLESLLLEHDALTAQVAEARGDAPSVADRATRLTARIARLADAATAAREAADAAARLEDARAEAAAAATAAGFATPEAASEALLSPSRQQELEARLAAWDSERAAVRTLLDDPALARAAAQPPADPAAAAAQLAAATARLRSAAAAEDAARQRLAELRSLGVRLTRHAAALAPALAEQARISRLSQLAAGTSSENRLRMRLESYVLAARLEQVAAAASSRLVRMSGGRYTLVHSDSKASGNKRAGLSLHVVDAWTGTERDTATLSGGESFFASLALALGLADVVTDEAGGMPLDTLFIDEGFGTLDEQALEEVLDVLDGLRERDRAVGIVSHVADLRQRIPAQLLVHKTPRGSTLRLSGPDSP
ncbi:AAA family ATPase [Peterkaempfera griseoplana]|uniref:AAA family ATPase n=1 Tax=Peterkaempfera griseoplana TaxID=66896 RepID=UPI0006E16517|nr:SMC family ATPase [Peterkaempfera griseoplana]